MRVTELLVIGVIVLLANVQDSIQGRIEASLLKDLFLDYNVAERPVSNESIPVNVTVGVALIQLINLDVNNQVLTSRIWQILRWQDDKMMWDPSDYGGITQLSLKPRTLWLPDVVLYNNADGYTDDSDGPNVLVLNSGNCLYVVPKVVHTSCPINSTIAPNITQSELECNLKFGSWTAHGDQIDLHPEKDFANLIDLIPNPRLEIIGQIPADRHVVFYPCCPNPFLDITYTIKLRLG